MRVLIVSDLYPPYYIGGEELGCYDVAETLKARGHQIHVLTSNYRVQGDEREENIYRVPAYAHPFIDRRSRRATLRGILAERRQMQGLGRLVARLKPDVVFCFGISDLSDSSLKVLQHLGVPMLHYVASPGLLNKYCQLDPLEEFYQSKASNPLIAISKRLLQLYTAPMIPRARAFIRSDQLCFTSESLRQQYSRVDGLQAEQSQVIYWGIEPIFFTHARWLRAPRFGFCTQVRVVPEKGVRTAVEMVERLAHRTDGRRDFVLDIVGDGDVEYMAQAKRVRIRASLECCTLYASRSAHRDAARLRRA